MIVAKIQVNGAIAKTVYRKVIPAGIIGAQIEFDYDEDIWHGLHKTVVFKGAVTKDVVTDANIVTIPHEVVEKPFFRLRIGVYGVDADGNIAIPTLWEDIGAILDAAAPSGDTNTDPSLPVWAQIQAMIGNLNELETTARDNLVAAVNEVAQSVGDASITMRVDGGFIQYSTDNGKTWVNLIAEADLKGDKGADGITPHIGENGNWYIGSTDTGNPSRGATGSQGLAGAPGKDGAGMDITGATVGQIAKITAVDDTGKPTAWEAVDMPEQVQPDWNQNDATQPDYVKNKPFYLEKTLVVELTKDDFTVNNQDGYIKYMYRSTPKLDWLVSADSIAFEIEIVDTSGRRYTATQDSIDVDIENGNTDDGYEYWSFYSALFDIVSGVDLDYYDDDYYYKDEWGVLVNYYGIEFSEINIKIYRVDVKKIPKICLDAAIGKTAITVGEVLYGSEGEIPTNVVVPDLFIPVSPPFTGEEIYYDRMTERLKISGDLFPYRGVVEYVFNQAIPTTAGSSISFDISSEGDTLWDQIGWNSPWNYGRYLTFDLHSYYISNGVTTGGVIEFLARGNSSGRNITAVAASTSGHLYTALLRYTNSNKTLNVTLKCVA